MRPAFTKASLESSPASMAPATALTVVLPDAPVTPSAAATLALAVSSSASAAAGVRIRQVIV